MFNPPPDFGPYDDIEKRMIQRIQAAKLEEKILAIVQTKYEEELARRSIVLSRSDRKRLFQQVLKTVLNDTLGKLSD